MKIETYKSEKVFALMDVLHLTKYAAVGLVESVLQLAGQAIKDGDFTRVSASQIAYEVGWERSPSELMEGLVKVGLLHYKGDRLLVWRWSDDAPDYVHRYLKDNGLVFGDGVAPSSRRERSEQVQARRNGKRQPPEDGPDGIRSESGGAPVEHREGNGDAPGVVQPTKGRQDKGNQDTYPVGRAHERVHAHEEADAGGNPPETGDEAIVLQVPALKCDGSRQRHRDHVPESFHGTDEASPGLWAWACDMADVIEDPRLDVAHGAADGRGQQLRAVALVLLAEWMERQQMHGVRERVARTLALAVVEAGKQSGCARIRQCLLELRRSPMMAQPGEVRGRAVSRVMEMERRLGVVVRSHTGGRRRAAWGRGVGDVMQGLRLDERVG